MPLFGQLVIGPPGSGKSTYCNGMQQYLAAAGRPVAVVNLDPANDALPYECAVDLADLVCLEAVMKEFGLGPNGGLMYCMEHLVENLDWLQERLQPLAAAGTYLLFDCPGQVELLTLHDALHRILARLAKALDCRLAAVHLVDSHLCADAAKYTAALLLSLNVMLALGLPHVNVLSKFDTIRAAAGAEDLAFSLEYYTEVQDLGYLVDSMGGGRFPQRFRSLAQRLCEVVEDFSLVRFTPLVISEADSVRRLLGVIDKATGYVFTGLAGGQYPPEFVYGAGVTDEATTATLMAYEDKYMRSADRGESSGGG